MTVIINKTSDELKSFVLKPVNWDESHQPVSVNRTCFFDYFICTKENYKSFATQDNFRGNITSIVREALTEIGTFSNRFKESSPQLDSFNPPLSGSSLKSDHLDNMHKERTKTTYYVDIKSNILKRIQGKDWRNISELNMSDEMYKESMYFMSAPIRDAIGMYFADKTLKIGKHYAGRTIGKMIGNKKIEQKTGQIIGKTAFGNKKVFSSMEGSISVLDITTDISSYLLENNEKFQTINFSDMSALYDRLGLSMSEEEIWWPNMFATGLDYITDLNPTFRIGKYISKSFLNVAVGIKQYKTAGAIKKTESQSNEAEEEFNRKLKQTIYDDVNSLSLVDIENLIDLLGLEKLTI